MSDFAGTVRPMRAAHYRGRAAEVRAFLSAYSEFVGCVERVPDYRETWAVRPDAQHRVNEVMARVSLAAGRAAGAFQESGMLVAYKPPGTMQTTSVNPALVWSTLLDTYAMVTADLMFTVGNQVVGRFESLAERAAERERGLAGFFARFLRFPSAVREAAGLEPRSVSGGLVSGFVVIVQGVFVTALGGAVAFPVAKLFGWA